MSGLDIRQTGHRGRGVFATQTFRPGDLIERCPVLVLAADALDDETLRRYVFDWRDITGGEHVGLALGYGSLYNHGWLANARWEPIAPATLKIVAHRPIRIGDEITINYHGEPDDPEPIDFSRR
jgi:hypothetical protein